MKYSRIIAAILAVTLVACTKKKSEDPAPEFPVVPADITFNKSALPQISDADYNEGIRLFTAMAEVNDVSEHLLAANVSTEDQAKIQQKYNSLSAEQQAFIEAQRNGCDISEEPGYPQFSSENPAVGESTTFTHKEQASGPNCGIDASNVSNGLMTILAHPSDNVYETGGRFSLSFKSSIKNPADQALMGYSSLEFSGASDSRTTTDMGEEKSYYNRGTLTGSGDLANVGRLDLRRTMEELTLVETGVKAMIATIEISKDGKTHLLSSHIRTKNGIKYEEHYLGNRQISAEEAKKLSSILDFGYE